MFHTHFRTRHSPQHIQRPEFQLQNSYIEFPIKKPANYSMKRIRTDTRPPELSDLFTTSSGATGDTRGFPEEISYKSQSTSRRRKHNPNETKTFVCRPNLVPKIPIYGSCLLLAIEIHICYFTKTQPWTCSSLYDKLGLNRPRTGEDVSPLFFYKS